MESNYTIENIYNNRDLAESTDKKISIIHFNDVYNIESNQTEPVAGAARFVSLVEEFIEKNPRTIVLFSGDAISPSSLSMLVKGKQMVEVLNKCHIACACLGNHDFDFGLDVLLTHISNSNFPWLLSNVFDADTKKPLANAMETFIIEKFGIKIGFIGLVEEEWIATLSTINYDDIIYESYVDVGRKLTYSLKNEHKCDIVIALTHMRWNNDIILAQNVPEIDIFLGGHDHDYLVNQFNNKWVIKSGTDFRELSYIELSLTNDNVSRVDRIDKYIIDSKIQENSEIKAIVDSYLENLNKELDVLLGHMNVELEGRFSCVRTQETNLGNFICDIMLEAVNADCAFINSGSLRSDSIHPVGEFKVRDLKKILPYLDESVVISITGKELHQVLENSVSQYPKHEGRFLQVAGIKFAFDPSKPSGNRVDPQFVRIQDEYLDLNKTYSAITKYYLKQGKDGFDCLLNCPVLIDNENIPVLYNLVENHFKTISKLQSDRLIDKFRSSIVPLVVVNRLINNLSEDPTILDQESPSASSSASNLQKLNFHNAAFIVTKVLSHKQKILSRRQRQIIKQSDKYKTKMREYEEKAMKLEPKLENRIFRIKSEEDYLSLLLEKEEFLKSH